MRRSTLLLLTALMLWPGVVAASPGRIVCIDNALFVAYCNVPGDYISRQENDNWCWAACVQMILRVKGEWLSQSEIVNAVYGRPYDWTATGCDIAETFNGWHGWRVTSFRQKSPQLLIDELVTYGPLLVGTDEHACLLTHIYFTKKYLGRVTPVKAILLNPKTGREEVLDWSDFFPAINTIVSFRGS